MEPFVAVCSQEEQFADLLKDRHQLSGDYTGDQSNTQYPGIGANHVNSN